MKKLRMCVLSAAAALAVAAGICAGPALAEDPAGFAPSTTGGALVAQDASIASGTWGTCPWEISADGTLTVHPGEGAAIEEGSYASYWSAHSDDIASVVFAAEGGAKVIAPVDSSSLFAGLHTAVTMDLSGLDVSAVTDISSMFSGCSSLKTVYVSSDWDVSAADGDFVFFGCNSLVGGLGTKYYSGIYGGEYACIDAESAPGYLTDAADISKVNIAGAVVADIPNQPFTGSAVTPAVTATYAGAALVEGSDYLVTYLNNIDTGTATAKVIGKGGYCGAFKATFEITAPEGTLAAGVWGTCPWEISADGTLTVHPGEGGAPSAANRWSSPSCASSVKAVVFAEENGSKVVARYCGNLLYGLSNVESVDLFGLDTSGVSDMHGMFNGCSSLESVDLSGLDTSNVSTMFGMFSGCSSLKSVDFTGIATSKVTQTFGMFSNCASLASLDLSSFDTSGVTMMYGMFSGCSSLATVYVGDAWSTAAVGDSYPRDMFEGCMSIVGGNGTSYDASHVDVGYARVDAEGSPGYLTYRAARPSVADAAIVPIPDQVYTGKAIEPAVTVTLGGKALVAGTDYAVSYRDNVEVGTATVTVAGRGGYVGSKSATFAIVAPQGGDGPSGGGSGGEAAGEGEGGSGGGSASGGAADPGSGASADPSGEGSGGAADPSGASPEPAGPAKADPATFSGAAAAEGFADLAAGAWYMSEGFEDGSGRVVATYLDYAIGRGLMSGYSGTGRFGPDDTLTRGMGATIVYRMATGATAATTDNDVTTRFSDVPRGAWYAAAVKWCSENGVVTGYAGTDRFGPDDPITREQLATIIGRYMDPDGKAGADASRFADASSIHGYARGGVAYCSSKGIMTGIGSTGRFDPAGLATRCQMAKVIAVTASLEG